MENSKTTRAEKILESLTLRQQLSPEGRDFLLASLDPMHDNPIKDLVGWPDVETAPSVVRCIKQSMTITNPTASGPWDLHLVQWPWMSRQKFCSPVRANNNLVLNNIGAPGSDSVWSTGGLCGYISEPGGGSVSFAREPNAYLTLADQYSSGPSRIIGMGVEVNNTTADVYKQGQVFTWRMPQPQIEPNCFTFRGNIYGGALPGYSEINFDGQMIMCPPKNSNEAMLIPGTRQWRAEEGCYLVAAHVGQENPPLYVDYVQPVVRLSQIADTTIGETSPGSDLPSLSYNTSLVAMPVPLVSSTSVYTFPAFRMYPIHLFGALFAGLSAQTSLTVSWNVYLETFPTVADPNILVLATPSAEYDPIALQLYSHALTTLPVGVPSDWNGFGDWFADVVSKVTDVVTPIGAMLGQPEIAAISGLANRAANAYLAPPASGKVKSAPIPKPVPAPSRALPQRRKQAAGTKPNRRAAGRNPK